jgi:hypothetical protein
VSTGVRVDLLRVQQQRTGKRQQLLAQRPRPVHLADLGPLRMNGCCVFVGNRLNPTQMTTRLFRFDEVARAFEVSGKRLDDVIKPLISF